MSEIVRTPSGTVRGRRIDGGGMTFLSVPYAAPPTEELRWAPPRPAAPWTGVRDTTTPGPICPQPDRPFSVWAHGPLAAADEDSLSVHVWTPADPDEPGTRPVFVFLHGGGWALGWGSNPMLDGRHLARALDAVVVVVNYRLGSLGWLHHPDLATVPGAPIGNWGLLDQIAALRWVNAHIGAFGGDPARVTLAGESAGAGSVLHLLGTPAVEGLFARVIAQSPPLHELTIDSERGARYTEALVSTLELGDDVATALTAMRTLPATMILAAQEQLLAEGSHGPRGGAMPIVDPAALPADPARVPQIRPEVPMLIGTNADEATFFFRAAGRRLDPGEAELPAVIARLTHLGDPDGLIASTRQRLAADGRATGVNDVICAAVTEAWFAGPVTDYARARARAGATVHRYRLDHPAAEDDLGAVHSLDVALLFATQSESEVAARLAGSSRQTAAVTAAMTADWRRFVHGEPLGWAAVSGTDRGPGDGEDAALAVYGVPDPQRSANSG
jgi:para-nitrobenzyl esterase